MTEAVCDAAPQVRLPLGWKQHLLSELQLPYMQQLKTFLLQERDKGKVIYPRASQIFAAFDYTDFDAVKVVILGQDPYHGAEQAHGLCFSVQQGVPPPPSLINIYKELKNDLGIAPATHGSLVSWAKQGVLLLNSVLTVEQNLAASHQGRGWETFTDHVIKMLNEQKTHLVFVLWGSYAQKKGAFIDRKKHLVIESAHPSPLSAHRGFLGSKPFSKINLYLQQHHITPIDWKLP